MQTVSPSEMKRGLVLIWEGMPHYIEEVHATGAAKMKPKLHARLRNLKTGRVSDHVFSEAEKVTAADFEQHKVLLSYRQGDQFVFSDVQNFEEFVLTRDQIGERHWFMLENREYRAMILEGKILDVVLPAQMSLQIIDTAPAHHGSGSDSNWKVATIETGLEVMVPPFIDNLERIRVNTADRTYVGKDTEEKKG